jgi:hypothetical protein
MRTVCPAGPYFTALSSRLSSVCRSAERSTVAVALASRSGARATPRACAIGANASTVSRTSSASCVGSGERRVACRSLRENCSTFSTRCVRRRASWSMISSERRASASLRTRPSSSVSANMRTCASGVRSSCEMLEMKSPRIRASAYSRRICRMATTTSAPVSASSASSCGSRACGSPPITSRSATSGRSVRRTFMPPNFSSR